MDDDTGRLPPGRGSKAAKMPNGGINGVAVNGVNSINGAVKSPLIARAVAPRKEASPRGPGWLARTINIVARLLTWYSIFTVLFRCPASLDACDDASPRICKPYFQLRHAVAPHVEPYYDAYAAPYVDLVRPYYDAVDQRVITPSWGYLKEHGAPRLEHVQAFGRAQWEKSVQPQVDKYQDLARAQYDERLAPHVRRVSTAVGPYYEIARTNSLQTYHELLLPAYQYAQPHVWRGYRATSAFASATVVPAFAWTWNKTYAFLDGTVGPHLRAVYAENVEPQLVRIGKRLGRYSSGKKSVPKSLTEASSSSHVAATSSFAKPSASVSATSSSSSAASTASVAPPESRPHAADSGRTHAADSGRTRAAMEPVPPPEVDEMLEQDDPLRREAREIVAADLRDWQERYAKAADEGAAEIDERVQEIAKKMIRRNARVTGKSLLQQLQDAAVAELVSLRSAFLEIVAAANAGNATPEQSREQIVAAVRQAGVAVKDHAQAVRTWRETYDAELQAAITSAANTHFAILENIRDLALQRIGMKWAWMEGVTYKDWAKYHLLKSRFDEWKGDLERHVVSHPSIEAAQVEAANIEDEAMTTAAATAKELARLKQVAQWKLAAGDESDEFDSTLAQQAAEAAEAARLAAAGAAEAVGESAKKLKDSAVNVASEAVSSVTEVVGAGASHATEAVGAGASHASDAVSEGVSYASEAAGQGASLASEAVSKATDAIIGSGQSANIESTPSLSETSDPSSEPALEGSLALEDALTSPADAVGVEETSEPEAEYVAAVSDELSSVVEPTSEPTAAKADVPVEASSLMFETPVMMGNFTEPVEDKAGPIELPVEDHDLSENAEEPEDADDQEAAPPASDTRPVKPALFGAAAQSVPSRRPILDDDGDISEAVESMRENLKSAYASAMSRANDQYSQALSVVSAQIHGTTQPAHQQLLASVTSAYSQAMASASARLDDAVKVASGQLHGTATTKQGILPTSLPVPEVLSVEWSRIESIASERLQQGRAWAEEQYSSAKVAIGLATPTPSTPAEHAGRLLANAQHNYYAGLGLAHARYSEFVAAASSAFSSLTATPTPTDLAGTASSMASVASESAASAASAAGEGASSVLSGISSVASVAGENVSAAAAAGYDHASSAAAAGYDQASSAAAAGYDAAAAAGSHVAESWDAVLTKISVQVYGAPTPTPWYSSVGSAAGEYASAASSAAGEGAAAVTSAASAGSDKVARQYAAASAIVSELLVGKEPSFSESVVSRLSAAYATGAGAASSVVGDAQATAASAASQAGEAVKSVGEKVVSVASEATEAVKEKAASVRDEL